MSKDMRYSFDDIHIGRMRKGARCLEVNDVKRPEGISRNDWYKFAGEICVLLNEEAGTWR